MQSVLDIAIEKVRSLPQAQQDLIADILLEYTESEDQPSLTNAQLEEVRRRLQNPNPQYATLAEVTARLSRKYA